MNEGERPKPIEAVLPVFRSEPGIEKVIVFGSRAIGDNDPRSDLDLAIFCPRLGAHEWATILNRLDVAPTLIRLDIHRFETLSAEFRAAILREGKVIYERPQEGKIA